MFFTSLNMYNINLYYLYKYLYIFLSCRMHVYSSLLFEHWKTVPQFKGSQKWNLIRDYWSSILPS